MGLKKARYAFHDYGIRLECIYHGLRKLIFGYYVTLCHNASLVWAPYIYWPVLICIHSSHTTASSPSKSKTQWLRSIGIFKFWLFMFCIYVILAYAKIVVNFMLYTTSYCSVVFLFYFFCYFVQILLINRCNFRW